MSGRARSMSSLQDSRMNGSAAAAGDDDHDVAMMCTSMLARWRSRLTVGGEHGAWYDGAKRDGCGGIAEASVGTRVCAHVEMRWSHFARAAPSARLGCRRVYAHAAVLRWALARATIAP